MPPGMMSLLGATYGMELIYSFLIIAVCLIIYFETKQIYRLSSHKGIKYFRYTFLFFAISYLLKFISRLFLIDNATNPNSLFLLVLLIFTTYSYLMAGIYLVLSISWKKKKAGFLNKTWLWHIFAILVVFITIFTRFPVVYILSQTIIFVYALVLLSFRRRKLNKKETSLVHIIYPSLLVFWILNILDLFISNFLIGVQILIYLFSTGLFLSILYKVIKRINTRR